VGGIGLASKGGKEVLTVKTRVVVLTASLLTLALPFAASAQSRPVAESAAKPVRQVWSPQAGSMESGKLIGMKVKNDMGKAMGEIDGLIVDQSDGRISSVVLGLGGLLGVGEQKVVVAWKDLSVQPDPNGRNHFVATVAQSTVDAAPRYEARRDREMTPAASPSTAPAGPSTTTPAKKY
jgi:sporulation protein YlmC with PRC-barrel domain